MRKYFVVTILLFFIGLSSIYSHPHLFFESKVLFIFSKYGLKNIKITWFFDEMFSAVVISDYDGNSDGIFDTGEIEKLRKEIFWFMEEYDYFSQLAVNRKKIKVEKINDFTISILDGTMLEVSFLIPCEIKAISNYTTLTYAAYDHTFYADIQYTSINPVQVKGLPEKKYKCIIIDHTKRKDFDWQSAPQEIILKFRK